MIRHIVVYQVKDEGKKEEHIAKVLEALEAIRELTDCVAYSCGRSKMGAPGAERNKVGHSELNPERESDTEAVGVAGRTAVAGAAEVAEAAPGFGDVAQVVDFETPEKAAQYPASEAHKRLFEATHELIEGATVIDFEM